jgi:hypothetical protein
MIELGWVKQRRGVRAIEITTSGHRGLRRTFGIDLGRAPSGK